MTRAVFVVEQETLKQGYQTKLHMDVHNVFLNRFYRLLHLCHSLNSGALVRFFQKCNLILAQLDD